MKKKIIKFYFFKNTLKQPAIAYLSCFSKKFLRQKKQMKKFYKSRYIKTTKKSSKNIQSFIKHYKYLKRKIILNQWAINHKVLYKIFIKSYYNFHKLNKNKKSKLVLWFILKNRTKKKFFKKTKKHTSAGFVSSYNVHFLLKKNLTYLTWSKYNNKIFDTLYIHLYIIISTKIMSKILISMYNSIYFYTLSFGNNSVTMSENLEKQYSTWQNVHTKKSFNFLMKNFSSKNHFFNYNFFDYNNKNDLKNIKQNSSHVQKIIQNNILSFDQKNKELSIVNFKIDNTNTLLNFILYIFKNVVFEKHKYQKYLFWYTQNYKNQ